MKTILRWGLTAYNPTLWPSDYTWQHYYERIRGSNGLPLTLAAPAVTVQKDKNGTILFGERQALEADALVKDGQIVVCATDVPKGLDGEPLPQTPFEDEAPGSSPVPVPFLKPTFQGRGPARDRHLKAPKIHKEKQRYFPPEIFMIPEQRGK